MNNLLAEPNGRGVFLSREQTKHRASRLVELFQYPVPIVESSSIISKVIQRELISMS
jgi:hypothetical protein